MTGEKDSFSHSTKEELARAQVKSRAQAHWETQALRRYLAARTKRLSDVTIAAEPFLMRRLFYLAKRGGGETPFYYSKLKQGTPKPGAGHPARGLKSGIWTAPNTIRPALAVLLSNAACRRAFLRGAFLARGSVASPVRNHHLELAMPTASDGHLIQSLLNKEGLKGGLIRRRSSWVAYLKDADEIAEFLRMIGASQAVLAYEDIRTRKSLKSSVQRLVNMDRANVSRSVEASIRQLQDIQTIDETVGLGHLPPALKELARLRMEHQDLSMEELGQLLAPPASKSAVNHRFRRITEIAEGIRRTVRREQEGGEPKSPAR